MGLIGRKCGMTRILDVGNSIPVSVIEVLPNKVTQIKSDETDGYHSVQVSYGIKKASRVTRPLAGHYAKAKVEPGTKLLEFRSDEPVSFELGQIVDVSLFTEGQYIDVVGTSKGKGFAGTVKRYNFRTQDATHGNSRSHRVPGSIGQNQTPGRVFKGKKMAGHMGNVRCTTQNLQIVKIDKEKNLLLVKGAIPGATGGCVIVQPAVKKSIMEANDGA
jgi:large subunit ribosomal protein L3